MAIAWSEEYETGVASIDRQHQKLFQYVNKLENVLNEGTFEGEKVDEILEFIGTYTKMHFTHEEFCMADKKCPSAEENKRAHDGFLNYYTDFIINYTKASSVLGEKQNHIKKLHKVAEDWLVSHICKIDVHLKGCIKKNLG